nr:theta carbonic anhydrase 2 [Thalassiosira pseudonana CCMP1335]
MLGLNKAFTFLLGANLVAQSAAFAPSISGKQVNAVQLMSSSNDDVVDVATREARITTPLSIALASMAAPLAGLSAIPTTANAASASAFEAGMRKSFPGSLPNSAVALRVASALKERGYTETNTLFASSFCSDEINDTPESLVADFQNKMQVDGVFNLGGLGGLPFVGITGMGAFLSHCPEQGKVFIVFGPHVGISDTGAVGTVERIGQNGPHTSCGAGIGAYKAIMGKPMSDEDMAFIGTKDFQEEYIIAKLRDRLDVLRGKDPSDETITYVTNKMYDLVWEMLRSEINAYTTKDGFWKGTTEVTLLGGIVVNRGHGQGTPGGEDFFQPLMLKSLTQSGESDLYGEVFGDFPALAAPHRNAKYV